MKKTLVGHLPESRRFYFGDLALTEVKSSRSNLEQKIASLEAERDSYERFVAMLTHDLRTPLTAARMNAQRMKRPSSDGKDVATVADKIIFNIDRADRMMRDLLDQSRMKAGRELQLSKSVCRLDRILATVVEEMKNIHDCEVFVETLHDEITGEWDACGLQRVFENLISNAVKYGSELSPVTVRIALDDNSVIVSVNNYGSPISARDQKKLFDVHTRVPSSSKCPPGWGMGLAIVKGISEAHGGSVGVESSAQAGTTFSVRLPL